MVRIGKFETIEQAKAYVDSIRSREPLAREAIMVSNEDEEKIQKIAEIKISQYVQYHTVRGL